MEWFELIEKLLYLVITIVVGFLGEFLRRKGTREKIENIKISQELKEQIAYTAVLFAQQWYSKFEGESKFVKASEFLSSKLLEFGVHLSDDEIRALVESSLKKAKKEFKEVW